MVGDPVRYLTDEIRREGPIPFDRFVEAALYHPDGGFFAVPGGAGRATGDFITSPEVGSLFGALVARQIDSWWTTLGAPDPFVVVDAGAGRGQLARDVLRAGPGCLSALRYVLVERSAGLRRRQHEYLDLEPPEDALGPAVRHGRDDDDPEPVPGTGPIVTQTETLPAIRFTGAIVANELLDNLPFRVVERRADGWWEVRVGTDDEGDFHEVLVPAETGLAADAGELVPAAPPGVRLPVQTGVRSWFAECAAALRRGFVAVVDYADSAEGLAARGHDSWLRTYRGHERGGPPTAAPGTQDITCDVVTETLLATAAKERFDLVGSWTQAEWLEGLGIDALVEEGRQTWRDRAHLGDLEALQGRSRVSEAEALVAADGLGAHRVIVFSKGL